jgi:hypothetical protein
VLTMTVMMTGRARRPRVGQQLAAAAGGGRQGQQQQQLCTQRLHGAGRQHPLQVALSVQSAVQQHMCEGHGVASASVVVACWSTC